MNHRDITARHAVIVASAQRAEVGRWLRVVGLLGAGLLIMVACIAIIIN